jgi:hypothetical protein
MTISAAFLAELARPGPALDLWIEIEGLPYGFGLTARGATWFGRNLIGFNPSFETDLAGWVLYNNGGAAGTTLTRIIGDAAHGAAYARVAWTTAFTAGQTRGLYLNTAVVPNRIPYVQDRWFTLRFKARASAENVGKYFGLGWNAPSPAQTEILAMSGLTSAWQQYAIRYRWSVNPNTGTTPGALYLSISSVATGGTSPTNTVGSFDIDEIVVESDESRAFEHRRDGVLRVLIDLPAGVEQEVRPYEAESSIGQLTAALLDDEAGFVRAMYANTARTDDWGHLDQDLAAPAAPSQAPATVDVQMTVPPGALVGSYLYVGRETMEVVSFPSAGVVRVYRGMFRPPTAIDARAYQHTAGDVVTTYPRFLRTRRAYLYSAPLAGTDAGKVARWAGTVQGAKLRRGLTGVDLTIESLEVSLRAKCFTGQIRGKLSVGTATPDGTYERDESEPAALTDRLRLEPSSVQGRAWVDGQRVAVRVGDELISGRLVAANLEIVFDGTSADDGRGLWGTPTSEHRPGDEVKEVILVVGKVAGGTIEERISRFTKGDNPLDLVLQLLTSVDGDAANGSHDVLPSGWGLGLDQSRLDVAEILATKARWLPAAREVRLIEEPFVAREFLASVLRTHLCYPVTKLDDQLTFRFLGPPMPDSAPRAISGATVLGPPGWTSGEEKIVGRMILRCDYDPIDGEWRQSFKGEFQGPGVEAQEFYAGHFDTPEIECPGQWSGNDPGSAKWGARLCTDAETTALRHFDLIRDRRARSFPDLELETSYDQLDVESGDLLSVTLAGVPDVRTGGSDLLDAICEVRRKTPDDRAAKVALTVAQVPYGKQYRLIPPSGIVSAGATASSATLVAHEFTDPAGAPVDASLFPVGAVIAIWSADLKTKRASARTITTVVGSVVAWSGGSVTMSTGDVLLLDDYALQPAAVRAWFAFLVDGETGRAPTFTGGDPAHEFTP